MTDWGGNYPPGAKNDPRAPYNQPDRSHEHEWRPGDMENPVIEDGAAIFHERCQYAEGRFGDGWECEETRTYRFEYSTIEKPDGHEVELPTITEWEEIDEDLQEIIRCIEEAFHDGDTKWNVDPDLDCGVFSIEWEGWTLKYEP